MFTTLQFTYQPETQDAARGLLALIREAKTDEGVRVPKGALIREFWHGISNVDGQTRHVFSYTLVRLP